MQGNDLFPTRYDTATVAETRALLPKMTNRVPSVISTSRYRIAIGGYDTVAYHTMGKPVAGSLSYATFWNDALWLFDSAEHRDMFKAEPQRYAPAYLGFCAECVADGDKRHGQPTIWHIASDGVLYLHDRDGFRDEWLRSFAARRDEAEKRWERVSAKLPEQPGPDSRHQGLFKALERGAEIWHVE